KAQNDHHVMQVGHNPGNGKLPFEADGQIDHDAHNHKQQGHQPVIQELLTHLRAHKLNPPELGVGIVSLQGFHDGVALAGRSFAFPYGQSDHDIARGAKVLHLIVGVAEVVNDVPDLIRLRSLAVINLHDCAACKFNGEINTSQINENDGGNKKEDAH